MTKCLSCGYLRHDLELNCPKCGSFYSTIMNDFLIDNELPKVPVNKVNLVKKIKVHFEHSKHYFFATGVIIFLMIVVLFL